MTLQYVDGDENCLFLNVYTTSLDPDIKTPVMVFLHGGAFTSGSGDVESGYGPEFLLQHDVVLVTLNYRLEVLGFLCLDTPEVPGNAGMKDQVAALRWVRDNIQQFGGDPNNITLLGESAGAASVFYHMQSSMSRGLFHKAICQSGSPLVDWTQGKDGLSRAFRVAKHLGKETNNKEELYEFLKNIPAQKFSKITMKTMTAEEKFRGLPIHFAPVVEKTFDNVEPFLSEELIKPLLQGNIMKIPMILGYNNIEGLLMLPNQLKNVEFINENPRCFLPREIVSVITKEKEIEFGQRIKKFYFGDKDINKDSFAPLLDLLTDLYFLFNTHRFAHFYSSIHEQVYMYRFCLDTDLNMVKHLFGMSHVKGACHADELFYIFHSALNKDAYEEQSKLRDIVFRLTKLWTNFAKTG